MQKEAAGGTQNTTVHSNGKRQTVDSSADKGNLQREIIDTLDQRVEGLQRERLLRKWDREYGYGIREGPLRQTLLNFDAAEANKCINNLYAATDETYDDKNGVLYEIISSFNSPVFFNAIKTPEEFQKYVAKILEISKLVSSYRAETGKYSNENSGTIIEAITQVASLIRTDPPDKDLDFLIDTLEKTEGYRSRMLISLHGIRSLITTSEELHETVGFVKEIQEEGVNPVTYLGNCLGYGRDYERGRNYGGEERLKSWQDSQVSLQDILFVLRHSDRKTTGFDSFGEQLSRLKPDKKREFIQKVKGTVKKGIDPQFVLWYRESLDSFDETKEGLAIFKTPSLREAWLTECAERVFSNPQDIEKYAPWLEKALTAVKPLATTIDTPSEIRPVIGHINALSKEEREEIERGISEADEAMKATAIPDSEGRQFTQELLGSIVYADRDSKVSDEAQVAALLRIKGKYPESFHRLVQTHYVNLFLSDKATSPLVEEFQNTVGVAPDGQAIQQAYQIALNKYIKASRDGSIYYDEDHYNPGEAWYKQLQKISDLTGTIPSYDLLQNSAFNNREFNRRLPFSIPSDILDEHFSHEGNATFEEYKRIYEIFGCYEYYSGLLARFEKNPSLETKKRMVEILTIMGLREENTERYVQIKEKILSFSREDGKQMQKSVAKALAQLAFNGDAELVNQLTDIIKRRSKGKEIEEKGKLGFTEEQTLALRTLMQLDNPTANESLLSLLFVQDINLSAQRIILNNISQKRGFLPEKSRRLIQQQINEKRNLNWDDLQFFQAILRIPSADLRRKALQSFDNVFPKIASEGKLLRSSFFDLCPSVPQNAYVQLYEFVDGDAALLEKFNRLYGNTKGTVQQDALLFGIVNALGINKNVHQRLIQRLGEIDFTNEGADTLAEMLKTVAFLDTVERRLGRKESSQVFDLLDAPVTSLQDLNQLLKSVIAQKVKEVLPDDAITAETIQSLWEEWGNLEPLFTYAGKMASSRHNGTLQLVAEMVPHMDPPAYEQWEQWRYNLLDRKVRDQIGMLTPQQRDSWMIDHFAELGDVMIATSPTDRPQQIRSHFARALGEGHIYNPDISNSDKYKFIQDKLQLIYAKMSQFPDRRETIIGGEILSLKRDLETIDSITHYSNIGRLQQSLTMFSENQPITINKRTVDTIAFLAQFLPKEQVQQLQAAYSTAEKAGQTTMSLEQFDISTLRQVLTAQMQEIESAYEKAVASDIFERFGLNRNQLKNVGHFYQKRQELQTLVDLLRLSNLTPRLIAINSIEERDDKKGESILHALERLKKYFKDNQTFLQDIDNIHATISQREDLGTNRRLAMLVTDNPQMLLQVGKYPTGCGSCQNYEGSPEWNKALAGYVADAHTKATFLIDLNKLSPSIRQEIEEKGFEAVKSTIKPQDLLEASLARAITKLVRTADGSPAVFIEPTYTQVNKGDVSMNKYFDVFLELMLANSMNIRLVRGGGGETIMVAASRNPSGQYEDAAAGDAGHAGMGIQTGSYTMSARIINKFTPVTDTDRALAERISQGSTYEPYFEEYPKAA